MIIQFILLGILAVTAFFALLRRAKAPLLALMILLLSGIGALFVISPVIAQIMADAVGISRGVDLVIYLFISIMLGIIFDIYLRFRVFQESMTLVVRRLSLLESEMPTPERLDKAQGVGESPGA